MNETAIAAVVSRIRFRDWGFLVGPMGDGVYLQVVFGDPTQESSLQTGRKWYVSRHAIAEEVVQTALKAVLTALEHEAREEFLVDGRAIYGPHFSLDALIEAADRHGEIRRQAGVRRHQWAARQAGGHPADAGSAEWVVFCAECGVEQTDENRQSCCEEVPA